MSELAADRTGHLKKLEEGDCIPHTPAPHSSPSTERGIQVLSFHKNYHGCPVKVC